MLFAGVNLAQKTENEVSDLIRLFQHEVVAYPRKQVKPGVGDPLGQQAGVRHRDDSVARSVEDEGWPGYGCRWDAFNQVFVVACNMAGKPFLWRIGGRTVGESQLRLYGCHPTRPGEGLVLRSLR